jgi:protocatechuate 3,4-dioxygenase beta subunit
MEGVAFSVSGQVLSAGCAPIPNARLDFWQADDGGVYDNQGFTLRGHQFSDLDGRYQLDTIVPGRYMNGDSFRPAHIHVKVSAPGFALVTTQLYFACDPYNNSDSFIKRQLIMIPKDNSNGSKEAVFDFVLAPADQTGQS